jgi:hypothetical protein
VQQQLLEERVHRVDVFAVFVVGGLVVGAEAHVLVDVEHP